ncbi:MAG TPA: hypothetical protein VJ599_07655 [Nitrososphaeraceae archaeon]|nr:hypothetical protein [Nitrososphaeraceae archaeon]
MTSYDLLYLPGESYTCTILFVTLNAKSIGLKLVDQHKQKPPPLVSQLTLPVEILQLWVDILLYNASNKISLN